MRMFALKTSRYSEFRLFGVNEHSEDYYIGRDDFLFLGKLKLFTLKLDFSLLIF